MHRNRTPHSFRAGVIEAARLAEGDVVEVEWNPDRRVRFRHLGSSRFEVVESVNSHLDVGDTAAVMLFVPGEPLLLSELSHRGKTGLTYLCGGKGGLIHLNFAILVDENADRASKLR